MRHANAFQFKARTNCLKSEKFGMSVKVDDPVNLLTILATFFAHFRANFLGDDFQYFFS